MKKLIVPQKYDGKKLSKYLLENIDNLSLNLLYKTLRKKDIKINGKRISQDIIISEKDEILVYIADKFLIPNKKVKILKRYWLILGIHGIIKVPSKNGIQREDYIWWIQ